MVMQIFFLHACQTLSTSDTTPHMHHLLYKMQTSSIENEFK